MNEDQLLEEILFIDFERIKISEHLSSPALKFDKIEDHNNTQDSSESEKIKDEKDYSLETYRKMVRLAAAEDTLMKS